MARDVNFVLVTGLLTAEPEERILKNNKRMVVFTLKVTEKFQLFNGAQGTHDNYIKFEALGKNADIYYRDLVVGDRYQITGYLRVDNDDVRVRCYNLQSAD